MKVRLFILTILMLATIQGFCITPASDTMQLQNDTILRKEYVEKLTRREQQLCDSIRRINEEIRQKEIEDGVYERIRSHHDNRLGIWITIVVALFGVVAPLIINRQQNKKTDEALKKAQNANSANEKLKKSIQDIADEAQRSKEEALKAVDETKALVFVVQALKEDDVNKQIVLCNRAIAFDNNLVDAYILRGVAYAEKGEHDFAIEDYSKAIEIKPDNARPYILRGEVYRIKKEWKNAIKDLIIAIRIKEDFGMAYGTLGEIYRDMAKQEEEAGNKEQAIEYYCNAVSNFDKSLKLIPENDDYHLSATTWKKECEDAIKRLRGD